MQTIDHRHFYATLSQRVAATRGQLKRPLNLSEKLLAAHRADSDAEDWKPGDALLSLTPDRVAFQDATAQMALLQLLLAGRTRAAVPTTIHCDHLIRAKSGALADLPAALAENEEVYAFLRAVARKCGIGFWGPGSGIIHQVVLEQYAFPGALLIGTDSHTPNAGGLGALSIGAGGADAADVVSGLPFEVLHPLVTAVILKGSLGPWCSPKDVITRLCQMISTKGGTNHIMEYIGPGAGTLSATGQATICNMGAELGATGSIFPMHENMADYLRSLGRADIAELALANAADLRPDDEVLADPHRFYDRVIEIDLSELEPFIVGPHKPDLGRPVRSLAEEARQNGWPLSVSACLIGSCTNSSYHDMALAAAVLKQGLEAGRKLQTPLLITPGSEQVLRTIERDGILQVFLDAGATVLNNACGPCIGNWDRPDMPDGTANTIVSSFNRNFKGRNDGNKGTLSFLTSPEMTAAIAMAGTLDFDPRSAHLNGGGLPVTLRAPQGATLPANGFVLSQEGYERPSDDPDSVVVEISPTSRRLQMLEPFPKPQAASFLSMPVLAKTRGQTTTDHISPAGKWLRFRGHLDAISDNMLLGAVNAFTGETGAGTNPLTGETGQAFAAIARDLKAKGLTWVIVGDENYGEGSSREHAAMSPRLLGCGAVIVRSFARIHASNLQKQGILPLTFANPADYDAIEPDDRISIDVESLRPDGEIRVTVLKPDGRKVAILARHSFTADRIGWFWAGSALNARAEA